MIPEAERVRLQFLLYYILLELLFPLARYALVAIRQGHKGGETPVLAFPFLN